MQKTVFSPDRVMETFCGIRIITNSAVPDGQVIMLNLVEGKALACNTGTKHLLKQEVQRNANGEPSLFSAFLEELDSPVI